MVAGSGRNMARTLRESSSKFSKSPPFSNARVVTEKGGSFAVDPNQLIVGDLCSGGVYKCQLTVKNRGLQTGRFRIGRRGAPTKTMVPGCDSMYHQMRVIYHPGPLAAGMKRKLEVEIAALSVENGANVEFDDYVEVVASEQILRIPIYGQIVDATKHDRRRVGKQATLVSKIA
jgi:hypothetical protein